MSVTPPPLPSSASNPGIPQRNWMQRNIKWLMPLLMVIVVIWACLVWRQFQNMGDSVRESEPYQVAVTRVWASMEVESALGRPLTVSEKMMGVTSTTPQVGQTVFFVAVEGPRGRAQLSVSAMHRRGHWVYDQMQIISNDAGLDLDLRTDEEQACLLNVHCP